MTWHGLGQDTWDVPLLIAARSIYPSADTRPRETLSTRQFMRLAVLALNVIQEQHVRMSWGSALE
ncbi:unnamed protein product [Strongylus vulgaris]|uniref:Uncharacterized protein n=1 Tax=Strongylus vulgaris TaxID=40348 RepID=A0A3P7IWB8_STRVU|nr:unnamed protein product [Strongylus vulgaris]